MASATFPDGIAGWENNDPASMVQMSQAMADSVQVALDKRQRYNYVWADSSARGAQAGMAVGSMGYQLDIEADYIYTGTTWRIFNLMMQPFTPSFIQGWTAGNATVAAYVSIAAGWAFVNVAIIHGTTSNVTNDLYMHAPTLAPVSDDILAFGANKAGYASYWDNSVTTHYEGSAQVADAIGATPYPNGVIRWGYPNGTPPIFSILGTTLPFDWAVSDRMHLAVNYPVKD